MTDIENIGSTGDIFGTVISVECTGDGRRIVIQSRDESAAMVQTGSPVIFHTDVLVPKGNSMTQPTSSSISNNGTGAAARQRRNERWKE